MKNRNLLIDIGVGTEQTKLTSWAYVVIRNNRFQFLILHPNGLSNGEFRCRKCIHVANNQFDQLILKFPSLKCVLLKNYFAYSLNNRKSSASSLSLRRCGPRWRGKAKRRRGIAVTSSNRSDKKYTIAKGEETAKTLSSLTI